MACSSTHCTDPAGRATACVVEASRRPRVEQGGLQPSRHFLLVLWHLERAGSCSGSWHVPVPDDQLIKTPCGTVLPRSSPSSPSPTTGQR
jgi:hypothetical protein